MVTLPLTLEIRRYHVESSGLGTGGGLYRFRSEILDGLDDSSYAFVLHCDVFCSFPLAEILAFHKKHGKDCTILGTKIPTSEARNYGIIVEEPDTHEVSVYAISQRKTSNSCLCRFYIT